MFNIKLIIFSSILLFYFNGCGCPKCESDNFEIPERIIEAGNNFIEIKTGKEFRKKYIDIDFTLSKFTEPYYRMVYRFRMPEKNFVDEKIEFTLDENGNIVDLFDIFGIPECLISNNECEFNINEEKVFEIAESVSFEKGIKGWQKEFMFHPTYRKYVWVVLSTLNETENSENYRGNGKELIINPFDGSIIAENEWKIR